MAARMRMQRCGSNMFDLEVYVEIRWRCQFLMLSQFSREADLYEKTILLGENVVLRFGALLRTSLALLSAEQQCCNQASMPTAPVHGDAFDEPQ